MSSPRAASNATATGTTPAMRRYAVVGAGAIGAYVGASLARAGADVTLIARGAHLAAMRDRGVSVRSERGDFHVRPPVSDIAYADGPFDCIILGPIVYFVSR